MRGCLLIGLVGVLGMGCVAEVGPLGPGQGLPIEGDPRDECGGDGVDGEAGQEPEDLKIFFVLDVSGSMEPFLRGLQFELLSLVSGLEPAVERGSTVTYWVVGFVNDVRWFPRRNRPLSSIEAVEEAIEDSIDVGQEGYNLNLRTVNSEDHENLLTAMLQVLATEEGADRPIIIAATDAPFAVSPAVLSPDHVVQPTLESTIEALRAVDAHVHAFVGPERKDLEEGARNGQDLRSVARLYGLDSADGNSRNIRDALLSIGRDVSCR